MSTISDLNPVNVNTLKNLREPIFLRKSDKNWHKKRECPMYLEYFDKHLSFVCDQLIRSSFSELLRLPPIPVSLFYAHSRTIDNNIGLHITRFIYSKHYYFTPVLVCCTFRYSHQFAYILGYSSNCVGQQAYYLIEYYSATLFIFYSTEACLTDTIFIYLSI